MRGERRSKQRGKGGNRAVHQTCQAGLHELKDEGTSLCFRFLVANLRSKLLLADSGGGSSVLRFGFGEIPQKLPGRSIGRAGERKVVEAPCFAFHLMNCVAYRGGANGFHEPNGWPGHKSLYILSTDERNTVAEAETIEFEQTGTVVRFFGLHAIEQACRGGIALTQTLCEIAVNPAIFFFKRDGESEDFAFGQVFEVFRHRFNVAGAHGAAVRAAPAPDTNRVDQMRENRVAATLMIARDPEIFVLNRPN